MKEYMRNIDWNFHINFSPMYAVFVIMCIILAADIVADEDEVIGLTFDGHPIVKKDVEVNSIRVGDIRGSKYLKDRDVLRLRMKNNKLIDVEFFGRCSDMIFMTDLGFEAYGRQMNFGNDQLIQLRQGDAFVPHVGLGNPGMPCRIAFMYEAIEENEDDEEN
tara:strand:+ start:695 stop:1180 length:486 start_codon:yes stop_codon:yes gene_type:complete